MASAIDPRAILASNASSVKEADRDTTITASTSATPVVSLKSIEWEQPCIVKGMSSAFGAGFLGYAFGFLPAAARHRSFALWRIWCAEGWRSAKAFAVLSGVYTAVQCIFTRIRQVDDGWNRGLAGCATGLAMGWSGGPMSAAQSCLGLGVVSYFIDMMGGQEEPAKACDTGMACSVSVQRAQRGRCTGHCCGFKLNRRPEVGLKQATCDKFFQNQAVSLPPVMWLGAICNQAYFRG